MNIDGDQISPMILKHKSLPFDYFKGKGMEYSL